MMADLFELWPIAQGILVSLWCLLSLAIFLFLSLPSVTILAVLLLLEGALKEEAAGTSRRILTRSSWRSILSIMVWRMTPHWFHVRPLLPLRCRF